MCFFGKVILEKIHKLVVFIREDTNLELQYEKNTPEYIL